MTEIEQFLSTQTLYRCERMDAFITQRTCDANRQRVDDLKNDIMAPGNCKGCPGLQQEAIDMAKNYRGTCPTCKRPDVLLISKNGDCHRCYKREQAGQDPNGTTRAMPSAPVKTDKAIRTYPQRPNLQSGALSETTRDGEALAPGLIVNPVPAVTDSEIHIVNLIDVFKQKQAADLDVFICELSKQPDPYSKLMYAFQRVTA